MDNRIRNSNIPKNTTTELLFLLDKLVINEIHLIFPSHSFFLSSPSDRKNKKNNNEIMKISPGVLIPAMRKALKIGRRCSRELRMLACPYTQPRICINEEPSHSENVWGDKKKIKQEKKKRSSIRSREKTKLTNFVLEIKKKEKKKRNV